MYQVCIIHMMDNKPWNAENEPTCTQFIVLVVSQSILDHFGCSRARFEGNYIYYQIIGHYQLQFWSVMTGHSHGFLESAVIWPVAVMADLGKWPDLTWLVNTNRDWQVDQQVWENGSASAENSSMDAWWQQLIDLEQPLCWWILDSPSQGVGSICFEINDAIWQMMTETNKVRLSFGLGELKRQTDGVLLYT